MPRFEPFAGVRFDTRLVDLADVTAPPYDVIDADDRARLVARGEHNAVRIDLPADEEGVGRYDVACRLYRRWQDEGILLRDPEASLYAYAMSFTDDTGRARRTEGMIGALELHEPGTGDVLPHEETTPRAKSDRLQMLRSCGANLSAIWGLSLASGLGALCRVAEPALASFTDELGVLHQLWRVTDPARIDAVSAAVASAPVVIADGHHRYETSLAYRDERRAQSGGAPGPYDAVMTYVVELSEEQLAVGPIHRLLSGLPADLDLREALSPFFEVLPGGEPDTGISARMADAGALAVVLPGRSASLLRPRPGVLETPRGLDSELLDAARRHLPDHAVAYQHGVDNVVKLVEAGEATAGVLLRPVPVDTIAAVARAGSRMPPKSTYFFPKLRTGIVFRSLAD